MKKCDVCLQRFSLKQQLLSIINFKMVCPNCKKQYRTTLTSRVIVSVGSILLPALIVKSFFSETPFSILIYLLIAVTILAIAPTFVSYKNSDNINKL